MVHYQLTLYQLVLGYLALLLNFLLILPLTLSIIAGCVKKNNDDTKTDTPVTVEMVDQTVTGIGNEVEASADNSEEVTTGNLCHGITPKTGTLSLTAELVADGLTQPLALTSPPNDQTHLFVVEQSGRIRIIKNGVLINDFLDISDRVSCCGERGLLGLAFHPDYANIGKFYVNYTDLSGDTRLSEFTISTNPEYADPSSERMLLSVNQPYSNHNGGHIAFGPDGYLYIGLGDGGSGGDPLGHAQNRLTLLGTILRINVDQGDPYAIPEDNPFINRPEARDEIWAFGLRNPWRFSFDRLTGDLYIGDVGQNTWEEINIVLLAQGGEQNYGWKTMEGMHCYNSDTCDQTGLTLPVLEYRHTGGDCSVTGGFVYRGCKMPDYQGTYFYGDYCSGFVRSFIYDGVKITDEQDWTAAFAAAGVSRISSFGEDAAGEIYILDYGEGEVFRIINE